MRHPTPGELVPAIIAALARHSLPHHLLRNEVASQIGVPPKKAHTVSEGRTFFGVFSSAVHFLYKKDLVSTDGQHKLQLTDSGRRTAASEPLMSDLLEASRGIKPSPALIVQGKPVIVRPPPPRRTPLPDFARIPRGNGESTKATPDLDMRSALAFATAHRVIHSLAGMPLSRLFTLWENASKQATKDDVGPEVRQAASILLDAIDKERIRRGDEVPVSAVQEGRFRWPSTQAGQGSGDIRIDAEAMGMLAMAGYRVGRARGVDETRRSRILTDLFEHDLPKHAEHDYAIDWGDNNSGVRLRKIAYTLAALTRNAKRRRQHLDEAIEQWEGDLAFLHDRFYVGRFDFTWPETDVPESVRDEHAEARCLLDRSETATSAGSDVNIGFAR